MDIRATAIGLVCTALAAVLLNGCTTVPVTGRSQLMFYGEKSDIELGEESWKEIQKQEKRSSDAGYNQALNRIGPNLAKVAERPDYKWEFVVFDSKEPNAFCLPGGKVAVYSALFELVDNDAELAIVVGHEVSHALARHGVERMSQSTLQSLGGALVTAAVGSEWDSAYQATSNLALMLPYSRTQEYEADQLGLILMAKAGYDPAAALTFWDKFRKLSQTGTVAEFLSTHPDGDKRLERLKQQLPAARQYYEKAAVKRGLGTVY
ncbi:M48 family metallopeptidase [Victivallis vadensis]|uniref:M48 family metallopeptidase n=1 Tax=Victivallis vadensis TaxID=172901 RepID=UPI0023F818AF|nr:M48 family metallopeptidase [Victivallis vadensis]